MAIICRMRVHATGDLLQCYLKKIVTDLHDRLINQSWRYLIWNSKNDQI